MEARSLQKLIPRARLLADGEATEQNVKALHGPALLAHRRTRTGSRKRRLHSRTRQSRLCAGRTGSGIARHESFGHRAGGGVRPRCQIDRKMACSPRCELETLDFHGSEMLVLSQCRMADGVPSSGDGVYGMRRAAAIAGVKTFVAPLWNVSDSTERALMVRFYKELSLGRGRAEALRLAMLQVMRTPQQKSFLYWAPVILTGNPSPLPPQLFAQ